MLNDMSNGGPNCRSNEWGGLNRVSHVCNPRENKTYLSIWIHPFPTQKGNEFTAKEPGGRGSTQATPDLKLEITGLGRRINHILVVWREEKREIFASGEREEWSGGQRERERFFLIHGDLHRSNSILSG